jgi:uncharacterized protein YjbI with pentapeptide repeats
MATATTPGETRSPDELLRLLDGLPLRDEVPGGRDLRGAPLPGAGDLDLREFDLSFAELATLVRCDLRRARLDQSMADGCSFGASKLDEATFRAANLRSRHLSRLSARRCSFDGANLQSASFEGSDLEGSSFRDARCKRANFAGANLVGCDFHGAILDGGVLNGARLDQTTDLRGASLVDTFDGDMVGPGGGVVAPASAWRDKATWDDTTRTGSDPLAEGREVLAEMDRLLARGKQPREQRLRERVASIRDRLPQLGPEGWARELLEDASADDRPFVESVLQDAYRTLL